MESLPLLLDLLLCTDLLLLRLFLNDSCFGAELGLRDAGGGVEPFCLRGEDLSSISEGSARSNAEGSVVALFGAGEGLRLSSEPLRDRDRLPIVRDEGMISLGEYKKLKQEKLF